MLPHLSAHRINPIHTVRIILSGEYVHMGDETLGRYGGTDYKANANDEIVVMAMIETKEGIENLDAICATPGLDAVYIGPADLSFARGLGPARGQP